LLGLSSGLTSDLKSVSFIHPIDVVKTRIQVESNKGNKTGIGAVISGALDKEGAGGKFVAGALAGSVGCTAGNPFDILKTKMMADKDTEGKGIAEYADEIMKFQGFMGFYRGYTTNVVRAMVSTAS